MIEAAAGENRADAVAHLVNPGSEQRERIEREAAEGYEVLEKQNGNSRGEKSDAGACGAIQCFAHLLKAYQTEQTFPGFIGVPALQANAVAKPGTFTTGPFTRHFAGECGFVRACISSASGVSFEHHDCA